MEDLSLSALKALILANQMITAAIVSFLVGAVVVWKYWEEVSYFLIRVWHSFPLVGTVARLSRRPGTVDSDGWINHEITISNAYYREYKKHVKGPEAYIAAQDYLSKAGESGRKERPAWVLLLVVTLVLIEAMGFAYVLAGWMNMDASTNDRHLLTAGTAALLAIASAVLAEVAGHALHHNSLIARARHWWQGEEPSKRSRSLKSLKPIELEKSFDDNERPDYEQLLTRIADAKPNVTGKYTALVVCFAFIAFMAVGAFVVRSATLDSIETEMINSMKAESHTQSDSSIGSPFDLPEESQVINDDAEDQSIQDKMDAIRAASLTTYVMLSVIYMAIQFISIWLASRYYFAGVHSKDAYRLTHEYATCEEMMAAMDQKRIAIASHADDKIRRLQNAMRHRDNDSNEVYSALEGANTAHRNFLAFIEFKAGKVTQRPMAAATQAPAQPQPAPAAATHTDVATTAVQADPVPAALVVAEAAPVAHSAPASSGIKASDFHDVSELPDEALATASRALSVSEEELRDIRAQQKILKSIGAYPTKKETA